MSEDSELERIRARKLEELRGQLRLLDKEPEGPLFLDDSSFFDAVASSRLLLVDFWADWCAPCKMVSPIVDELGRRYAGRLRVAKLNVDENTVVPGQFGIQSIPTLLLFKDGRLVDGVVGAVPKAHLEAMLRKWM